MSVMCETSRISSAAPAFRPIEKAVLGFGIIGTGAIAGVHARALQDLGGAALLAVADSDAARAQAFAGKHGARAHATVADLLADPAIDVVSICTPSGAREALVLQAAAAGKHILSEKPIEVRLDRIDRMIAACRANRVSLTGIFNNRFNRTYCEVREAIADGRLGVPVLGEVEVKWWRDEDYYRKSPWRGTWALDGGGALMNQSIHFIDLLQWFMGPVAAVKAYTATRVHTYIQTEDVGVAVLRFASGALGVVQGTTAAHPGLHDRLELHGGRGSVMIENGRIVRWALADGSPAPAGETLEFGNSKNPMDLPYQLHQRQFAELVECLRVGRDTSVNGVEARRAVEVIRAIYRSQAEGGEVVLPITD